MTNSASKIDTQFLTKCYLFENLQPDELEAICEIAREKDVIAGDYVFDEGAQATALYLIRHGSVEILKKSTEDEMRVTELSAGSHFGEMSFLDRAPRAASVMARENVKLIEIGFEDLERLLNAKQAMGFKVFRSMAAVLSRRIRQTTGDLTSLKQLKLRHL